ncbi:MAG: MoxR family ATPase [Pseudomonadota bacterium]
MMTGQAVPLQRGGDVELVEELRQSRERIEQQIRLRIVGQDSVVEHLLVALFARGHGLFVGVPGLAKTLLIHTLADSLGLRFSRIQFTPDLMPSDITGTDVLEEDRSTGQRNLRFIRGPLFAQIVLADEINRTPPKTQAALLQAMQELQITASGRTYDLEPPFMVFATQNPIEQEGTYPLPEAQLDRFMFMIDVPYPSREEEERIVSTTTGESPLQVEAVMDAQHITQFQELVRRVPATPHVVQHAVALARASRPQESDLATVREHVAYGAGPRAGQYLVLGAKARAALRGDTAASIDDVRSLAQVVLQHRVLINFHGQAAGVRSSDLVDAILQRVRP